MYIIDKNDIINGVRVYKSMACQDFESDLRKHVENKNATGNSYDLEVILHFYPGGQAQKMLTLKQRYPDDELVAEVTDNVLSLVNPFPTSDELKLAEELLREYNVMSRTKDEVRWTNSLPLKDKVLLIRYYTMVRSMIIDKLYSDAKDPHKRDNYDDLTDDSLFDIADNLALTGKIGYCDLIADLVFLPDYEHETHPCLTTFWDF